MPIKLATTVKKIASIPNPINRELVTKYYHDIKSNGASDSHLNNILKAIISFSIFLGPDSSFLELRSKEPIIAFLDLRIRSEEVDPDKKWITTWNDYLSRVKHLVRWLYNQRLKEEKGEEILPLSDWTSPAFINIKQKRTKRISPYSETELWELEDILTIIKYEAYKRNKAALALFWDLNARNHEVTLLKLRHIRLRDKYGEGEIPHESKTGGGPILLRCSFPYVRDWLNEHPFKNELDTRLICNLYTGGPVKADAMWKMMVKLKGRIIRLLETGSITNQDERQRLEDLIKTKRWNPYCIRHSAITSDSDYLPGYGLNKKVRWSMNSRQPARYIKRRMGNDLKRQILVHDGIISEQEIQKKPSVLTCARCNFVNAVDFKFCSKCSYPLIPEAYEEIKAEEDKKFQALRDKQEQLEQLIQSLIDAGQLKPTIKNVT
jgi:integrase/recombinase XerD